MRTFYDSTTTPDLPHTAPNALRYVDGFYADTEARVRKQCPHAERVVGVTVRGGDAPMADVELGDLSPASAARWAKEQLAKTGTPHTLYFPLSWHGQVAAWCARFGLKPGRDVLFFAARYGNDGTIPPGFVGVQYLSPDGPAGARPAGHYDVSDVVDYWPGVDPKPRLARLRHGSRITARRLNKAVQRRQAPLGDRADRKLVVRLIATLRRALGGGK